MDFAQGVSRRVVVLFAQKHANLCHYASVHLSRKRFSVGDLPPLDENSVAVRKDPVRAFVSVPLEA
jgi:hypothetical protein